MGKLAKWGVDLMWGENQHRAQRGFAVLGCCMLLLTLMMLGQIAVAQLALSHWQLSDSSLRGTQARLAAHSGLAQALAKLSEQPAWPPLSPATLTGQLGTTGSFSVTLHQLSVSSGRRVWQLESIGVAQDGRGHATQRLLVTRDAGEVAVVVGSWRDFE